jgi:hypothetical protein
MIIRNRNLVRELLGHWIYKGASRNVINDLVEAIVADLDDDDIEVEFETDEIAERIDFLIHVLGPKEGAEAVRAAIDGTLVLHDTPGDED